MKQKWLLIPFLLLYLLGPLVALGISLTAHSGELLRWIFWFLILPMYSVWGFQLFKTLFPTNVYRQVASLLPATTIIVINFFSNPQKVWESLLFDGIVLFCGLAIILILGLFFLVQFRRHHDTHGQLAMKYFVLLLISSPSIYLFLLAYQKGLIHVMTIHDQPQATFIFIGQIALGLSIYVPGVVNAFRQGSL